MDETEPKLDPNAPGIEDELARLAAEVPESEWVKLPDDLTDQVDHYLYGTPKTNQNIGTGT